MQIPHSLHPYSSNRSSRGRMSSELTIRNRIEDFAALRKAAHLQQRWMASKGDQPPPLEPDAPPPIPPPWVRVLQNYVQLDATITQRMEQLHERQREFFTPKFIPAEEEAAEEKAIQQTATDLQKLFKELDRLVQGIQPVDPTNDDECAAAQNVRRHLSTKLMRLGNNFRDGQQLFLDQLKQRDAKMKKFSQSGRPEVHEHIAREEKISAYMELGYTQADIQELLLEEENQKEMNAQIHSLVDSLKELSDMFKDLHNMVVEQGTVLDRIDYNITKTRESMDKGIVELKKAREHQKKCVIM